MNRAANFLGVLSVTVLLAQPCWAQSDPASTFHAHTTGLSKKYLIGVRAETVQPFNQQRQTYGAKRGVAEVTLVGAKMVDELEESMRKGTYWALIIGIDRYQYVTPLKTAVRDATAIRDILVERYGFGADRIMLLLDEQASREGIDNAFYQLGKKVGPNDSVFIYYAGHGQMDLDSQRGFWVPVDGKAQSRSTFISNAIIRDDIAAMKALHVYFVADSCFSGTLFAQSRSLPPLNDKYFARLYANKSRWGFTSGQNEPVADQGKDGHSMFAYFFLKLLKENNEPYLVPSHIYDQIAPLVTRNTEQQPRSEPLQSAGDEGGQFVFRLTSISAGGVSSGESQRTAIARAKEQLKSLEEQERQMAGQKEFEELQAKIELKKKELQVASVLSYGGPKTSGTKGTTGQDGALMVLIQAGSFWMGSSEEEVGRVTGECAQTGTPSETCRVWFTIELPRHQVKVRSFYLDTYEVTNRLFEKFVSATGYKTISELENTAKSFDPAKGWVDVPGATWRQPEGNQTVFQSNRQEHPVASVSWDDAVAYCRWAGKRLPTEAEWEYAARAGTQMRNSWGEGHPGSKKVANISDEARKRSEPGFAILNGYDDGYVHTAPVGSFDPNSWGLYDMIGNIAEWTADWYGSYGAGAEQDPKGSSSGQHRVFRGGSWYSVVPYDYRSAHRLWMISSVRLSFLGFRCAKDA